MKKKYIIPLLLLVSIVFLSYLVFNKFNNNIVNQAMIDSNIIGNEETISSNPHNNDIVEKEYLTLSCLGISDLYDTDGRVSYTEFFNDKMSLYNLKELNQKLNIEFSFIELCFQPLEQLTYYENDKKFTKSTDKEDLRNQVVKINGIDTYVTPLKSIQLGEIAFNTIIDSDDIYIGRGFNQIDFEYDNIIPVILGYEYKDIYKIGDIIEVDYLGNSSKLNVIGFLKENTHFFLNKTKFVLDQYICLPFFNIVDVPKDRNSELFQLRYYLQKNHGYIKIPSNKEIDLAFLEEYKTKLSELSSLDYFLMEYENFITIPK